MTESIFNVEHDLESGRVTVSFKGPRRVLSSATKGNVRAAEKKVLLAFRDLTNHAISSIEARETEGKTKRTDIDLE